MGEEVKMSEPTVIKLEAYKLRETKEGNWQPWTYECINRVEYAIYSGETIRTLARKAHRGYKGTIIHFYPFKERVASIGISDMPAEQFAELTPDELGELVLEIERLKIQKPQ